MGDSFDDEFLAVRSGEFWLYGVRYLGEEDEGVEEPSDMVEVLRRYEEDNARFHFTKIKSPTRVFERSFNGVPSLRLSPSKTGFDLIERDPSSAARPAMLDGSSSLGVGWGTTLARQPRTSSPFKTIAPPSALDVSPVEPVVSPPEEDRHVPPDSDVVASELDGNFHVPAVAPLSSPLGRRTSAEGRRISSDQNSRFVTSTIPANVNDTFYVPPNDAAVEPRPKFDETFGLDDDDDDEADSASGQAHEGTFVLNGSGSNGSVGSLKENNGHVGPGSGPGFGFGLGDATFVSPVEPTTTSSGIASQGSQESVCSGTSAESDSLNVVGNSSNLGRSMPNLAMKSRLAAAGSRLAGLRGLVQIRESGVPTRGKGQGVSLAPGPGVGRDARGRLQSLRQQSTLPASAAVRHSPAYRSDTKLNETSSRLHRPLRFGAGGVGALMTVPGTMMPVPRRGGGGPLSAPPPSSARPSFAGSQTSLNRTTRLRLNQTQSASSSLVAGSGAPSGGPAPRPQTARNPPTRAQQHEPAAPDGAAMSSEKYATFRKNSSAFVQQQQRAVAAANLNVTVSAEPSQQGAVYPTLTRPSGLAANRNAPAPALAAAVQPKTTTSGIARPSKLPGPGASRIGKPAQTYHSAYLTNGTTAAPAPDYECVQNGQAQPQPQHQPLVTLLPRKLSLRPPLHVPQWDDDCY